MIRTSIICDVVAGGAMLLAIILLGTPGTEAPLVAASVVAGVTGMLLRLLGR